MMTNFVADESVGYLNPVSQYINDGFSWQDGTIDSGMVDFSSTPVSAAASSTTHPKLYLLMDKGPTESSTDPGVYTGSSMSINSPVKFTRGPDYEELPPPPNRGLDDLCGYMTIDEGGTVAMGKSPVPVQQSLPNGKLHLPAVPKPNHQHLARRRSNPLYREPANHPGNSGGNTCCFCVSQTITMIVAAAALAVAIAAVVMETQNRQSAVTNHEDLTRKYESQCAVTQNGCGCNDSNALQSRFGDNASLILQQLCDNSRLQEAINSQQDQIRNLQALLGLQDVQLQNLTRQLTLQTSQVNLLTTDYLNITNAVDAVRRDLTYQISKLIHGSANFSMCGHDVRSAGSSALSTFTRTDSVLFNSTVVLMSVVCSTDGGTQAFLEYDKGSPSSYSCVCRGQVNTTVTNRFCYMHFWTCPIIP